MLEIFRLIAAEGAAMRSDPRMAQDITAALSLCTNLVSVTWEDDDEAAEAAFMPFLGVLRTLPLKEFTIRTLYGVGDSAWTLLNSMTGLQRLSVCSLGLGKSLRVLQGWAAQLGPTLRYLELGVSFSDERLLRHAYSSCQCSVVSAYLPPH